jgi:hypothetical protein
MLLRQFCESGIDAFRQWLAACREDSKLPLPLHLLEDPAHSDHVSPEIQVEPQDFETRRSAAEYLHRVLAPLPEHEIATNAGLWTWLLLYYFDQVCPPVKGRHDVTNDYSYVFEPKNSRHFYRHLLFIAWRVLNVAPKHNRLFLGGYVSTLDGVTTEVMKRLFLTRIPCIFEVLDRLYWDKERGKARPGIISSEIVRPGDLIHRLPIRIRQLEKTYDLHSLDANQLIELLGDEFLFTLKSDKATRGTRARTQPPASQDA